MIKTLIFDFGGVFLNLDKTVFQRRFGASKENGIAKEVLDCGREYEKGLVKTSEFLDGLKQAYPNLSEKEFIELWGSMLLDFPIDRLEFLKDLKQSKKYKLILLSNTNALHVKQIEERVSFFNEFKNCFESTYFSHEINMRKPDSEIFKFVLENHQLDPRKTLFIDDTPENTKSAEKLGLQIWTLDPEKEDVVDLFSQKPLKL